MADKKPARIKNLETDNFVFFVGVPFSQWHVCPFTDTNNRAFNSAEQYMMHGKAMLFGDRETAEKILQAHTPAEQKALGREVRNFDVDVWSQYAREIVYEGNLLKFSQNPGLWYVLAQTGDKPLVEAADYDKIWGIGLAANDPRCLDRAQWAGTNWLGETLTRLRDDFRAQNVPVPDVRGVSKQDREYAYAFLAMKIPGMERYTTLKAIADQAGKSVDDVIDFLQNTHPRDGDFVTFEAPTNAAEIVTVEVNAFIKTNSEPLAYVDMIRNAEDYDDDMLGVVYVPRLG